MKCISCDKEVHSDDIFCSKCGTKIRGKMKCVDCGHEQSTIGTFCSKCGAKMSENSTDSHTQDGDDGWPFLSFLFPVIGVIVWLTWIGKKPEAAKKHGIAALIGIGVGFLFFLILSASQY